MKKCLLLFAALAAVALVSAQPSKVNTGEKSDPQAKKLLDKVRNKYEAYKTLDADFTLTIEIADQPKEVQKGTISQDDKKFRLQMDDQILVSDGKTTWVYLKKNNEVQINDADPKDADSGFMSPRELLRRYEKGDFIYAITDKGVENGRAVTFVEFKPKDRRSEYAKLRLSIDEKNLEIIGIKAFAKDGSRYGFQLTRLTPNKSFTPAHFTFDPKKYPGVKVEDLRL